MSEELRAVNTAEVSERTTETVALEIRTLQRQAQGIILSYAIEIGRRLEEAKAMLPYGEWGAWLKRELNYSQSTAQNFMRVFREYGASQQSLFGAEAESQTFGNLTYSKALRLLAIPDEEEREKFVEEHDVASMSTRELEQALKERDEALKRAEELESRVSDLEELEDDLHESLNRAETRVDDAREDNRKLTKEYQAACKSLAQKEREADALQKELDDLRSRPVEVAVENASEEQLAQARAEAKAEAEEALKKKLDKAKADLKAAKDAQAKAEEAKNQAEAAKKAAEDALAAQKEQEQAAASEVAEKVRAEEAERRKALEKQLAAADPDTAAFKVYFQAWQEEYNRMAGCLTKIALRDGEKGEKLRRAVAAAVENMRQQDSAEMAEAAHPC